MSESTARVLIVDDTEANRYALRRFMELAGHEVLEAANGDDGFAAAEREHPDVIILDVNLPDTDGFAVCRRIKATPSTFDIPVIQVSASFVGASDQAKGLEGGADAYLTQPVEPIVLLATLRAVLRAHQVERELRRVQMQLRAALEAARMETFCIDWPTRQVSRFIEPDSHSHRLCTHVSSLDEYVANVHPEDRDMLRERIENAIANPQAYEADYRVEIDGRLRWRLERGQVVGATAGKIQLIGVSMDITERKTLTEALLQADRRKDEFLAMLAHELRNPLAPIRNAARVLGQQPRQNDAARAMISVIDRQVSHMTRLVDDLLDVSRITRGKIELKPEQVQLAKVIDYAVETTRPLIDARKHELLVDVAPHSLWVNGDFARLGQALANILSNAAKYTEPHGKITVQTHTDGQDAVISVKDNGIGIPRELLSEVFDLFMQGDRTLDRSQGGLGIGLALVKRLIEFHQGSVTAKSEGAGRGSEFIVRLPLISPRVDTVATDGEETAGRQRRVLIVDDNRDSAESMAALLRIAKHQVHLAYNGTAALELATTHSPEIVFLDIGLPAMNGLEVAKQLRKMPQTAKSTLIALTGYGQPEDRKRSLDAGFDQHCVKPLDIALMERILQS